MNCCWNSQILGGYELGKELSITCRIIYVFAVTEMNSMEEIDYLVNSL